MIAIISLHEKLSKQNLTDLKKLILASYDDFYLNVQFILINVIFQEP